MSANPQPYLSRLSAAALEIIHGRYDAAGDIFQLTRAGHYSADVVRLAEMLGLMSVKVEAREHGLENALAEIRRKNAELEEAARLRGEFGMVFSATVILLCLYAMTVSFLQNELGFAMGPLDPATQPVNLGLSVALFLVMYLFLKTYRHPLRAYGVTFRGWKKAVGESVLCVIGCVALLVLVRWWLVAHHPAFAGQKLIDWTSWGAPQLNFMYLFVSPAQELMTRGFTQSCIERLLPGKHSTLIAILLASAQFGSLHLHYSSGLVLLTFLSGIIFGWLYSRHRTIVGVSLAHFLLGIWVFGPLQLVG